VVHPVVLGQEQVVQVEVVEDLPLVELLDQHQEHHSQERLVQHHLLVGVMMVVLVGEVLLMVEAAAAAPVDMVVMETEIILDRLVMVELVCNFQQHLEIRYRQ